MPTYLDVRTRIASEYLNRTDYNTEIQTQVKAAIRTYEKRRYWFTETATALATVASQSYVLVPSDFMGFDPKDDTIQARINGSDVELIYRPWGDLKRENITRSQNEPTFYCIHGDRIELAPIPDASYTITLSYWQKLPALSADTDTNDWLSAAEDCIVYHACKLMYSGVIRDMEQATAFQALERDAKMQLDGQNANRLLTAIKKTQF